mgnify:CR=1 FL=1
MKKLLLILVANVFLSCALLQPKTEPDPRNEMADLVIKLIDNVDNAATIPELSLKEPSDTEKRKKIVYRIQSRTKTYDARCELEIHFFGESKRYVFKIEKINISEGGRLAQVLEIKTSSKQELVSLIRDNF